MHLYLKICGLVALCISAGAQAATNWQVLKVGGGGFVRGLNIASDGTMVGRTDTNGAYLWNGSAWVQLVNSSSLPAALINSTDIAAIGQGVFELQMAPSNSSLMYMMYNGFIFKSTNKGTTWTQTPFTQVNPNSSANPNDNYAQYGQKMAVDPNNSNIIYVGTEANGMFVTVNGGSTWSAVNGVTNGTGAGVTGILFYGNGPVVGGVTQTIYAVSNGNGVYRSTNGGSTWAFVGGPTTVQFAAIDTSGNYYAVGNAGANLFKYTGSWATLTSPGGNPFQAVAINPFNQSEIVAVDQSGQVTISNNAGSTWTGITYMTRLVTTDIPWLKAANLQGGTGSTFYLSVGGAAFSPTVNGQLILAAGTGVWTMNVPADATASTQFAWTDQSVGIENVVANAILVPPGGVPVLASWDRPFFKITNPNVYPSTYGPVASDTIEMGWSLDYASSNPGFIVGLSDWGGHEQSGYSTDGGATWTYFPTQFSSAYGGTIAASTPQNIVWAPANKNNPGYTTDGGNTWNLISLPGVSSWSGFHWAYYLKQRSVTADRVLPNTFYLFYAGYGVFKTTNGGANWTNVHSGYIESNSSLSGNNSTILSVPGNAGHLFYTSGWIGGTKPNSPVSEPFYRSTDGGTTWTTVPNVSAVSVFSFGAIASGQSYPGIYIVGFVNNVFGVWRSDDNAVTWANIGTYPTGALDLIGCIAADPNHYGEVYVGFNGGGYAYLPAAGTQQLPVPMAPTNLTVH